MMWKTLCGKPSWDEEVMDGQSWASNVTTQNHTLITYKHRPHQHT
jgi:hypothetical protein